MRPSRSQPCGAGFRARAPKLGRGLESPRYTFLLIFLFAALPLTAAPRPYHLQLEAYPAAPFPYLSKFGTVTLHVYPAGVRAETFWLNAFSRNGMASVTVENPFNRIYSDVPITDIGSTVRHLAPKSVLEQATPTLGPVIAGHVRGIEARRYRLVYGPAAWIDVWTSNAIAPNPQLRAIVMQFVHGISPPSAAAMRSIPGTPLYVELNFSRFHKIPLLTVKTMSYDDSGAKDALSVGALYFHAPALDSIWK